MRVHQEQPDLREQPEAADCQEGVEVLVQVVLKEHPEHREVPVQVELPDQVEHREHPVHREQPEVQEVKGYLELVVTPDLPVSQVQAE